jgi:hypothetical protein
MELEIYGCTGDFKPSFSILEWISCDESSRLKLWLIYFNDRLAGEDSEAHC